MQSDEIKCWTAKFERDFFEIIEEYPGGLYVYRWDCNGRNTHDYLTHRRLRNRRSHIEISGGHGGGGHGGGGRPPQIQANCVGRFGGNFVDKQTHVECQLIGEGLNSYRVVFENNGYSPQSVIGGLNQRARDQSFSSAKVSVGRGANYRVFVQANRGLEYEVFRGTATGKPF